MINQRLHFVVLLALIALAASFISASSKVELPKVEPAPNTNQTKIPSAKATDTPSKVKNSDSIRKSLERKPREIIDKTKAPDWFVARSFYLDEDYIHKRSKPVWLFQSNDQSVVPVKPGGLQNCVVSVEYADTEEKANALMLQLLGNWYRYQVSIELPKGVWETETDTSKFHVTIATTEHHPKSWCVSTLQQLVTTLDLKPSQIELIVPPQMPPQDKDKWVEGTIHRLTH